MVRAPILCLLAAMLTPLCCPGQLWAQPVDQQLTPEVRFMTVSDRFLDRVGVDFDFSVREPGSDLGADFYDIGVSTRIGGRVYLGPGRLTGTGAVWRPYFIGAFEYTHWFDQDDEEIANAIGDADTYLANLGLGVERRVARPFGDVVIGGSFQGQLGGIHVDRQPIGFDPFLDDQGGDAFLGGYRGEINFGVTLLNDIEVYFFIESFDQRSDVLAVPTTTLFNGVGGGVRIIIPLFPTILPVSLFPTEL